MFSSEHKSPVKEIFGCSGVFIFFSVITLHVKPNGWSAVVFCSGMSQTID
jgi:hypothetical protein